MKSKSFPSGEKSQLHWLIKTGYAFCSFTESKNLVLGRMDVEMHPEEPLDRSLL